MGGVSDGAGNSVWAAFDGRTFRLRMGLRPLDPAAWTTPPASPRLVGELDRKARLLAERPAEVLATPPESDAPAAELLDLLVAHLAEDHAERYRRDGQAVVVDGVRRVETVGSDLHPLDVAGRLVAEDWCLVAPGPPPVMAAATLCSPNRWRLADKLGRDVATVHDPVPGYRATLGAPVDRLLTSHSSPSWRRNWSIQSSPALFQPFPEGPARPAIPDEVWVRSEMETFVHLPRTRWWVFGIRTDVEPLATLRGNPALASKVRTAVDSVDPDTAAYKDLAHWRDDLSQWLAGVASV